MTTSPVTGITDELVAELEALASGACQYSPDDWFSADSLWSAMEKDDAAYVEKASPWLIRALLAERAELKRDADRYRWLRDNWFQIYGESRGSSGIKISIGDIWNHAGCADHVDAAIDAAMQSEAKP